MTAQVRFKHAHMAILLS